MFTRDEAIAFLTAEKLIENLTDGEIRKTYKEALFKIKAVLKEPRKRSLAEVEERIMVQKINKFVRSKWRYEASADHPTERSR